MEYQIDPLAEYSEANVEYRRQAYPTTRFIDAESWNHCQTTAATDSRTQSEYFEPSLNCNGLNTWSALVRGIAKLHIVVISISVLSECRQCGS